MGQSFECVRARVCVYAARFAKHANRILLFVGEGRAFNAQDACTELGIDAAELDKRWGAAKKNNKMTKFGGGFYCAELAREGGKSTIFAFNGFFM